MKPPVDFFFFFNGRAGHGQFCKWLRPTVPSVSSTPSWNSANVSLLGNLLHPHNLICTSSVSLYWFYKIVSCSKPQDAKVADDQHNDIAKCWSESTIYLRTLLDANCTHRWVPGSLKVPIKGSNKERAFPLTSEPGTHSIFLKKLLLSHPDTYTFF